MRVLHLQRFVRNSKYLLTTRVEHAVVYIRHNTCLVLRIRVAKAICTIVALTKSNSSVDTFQKLQDLSIFVHYFDFQINVDLELTVTHEDNNVRLLVFFSQLLGWSRLYEKFPRRVISGIGGIFKYGSNQR